MQCNIHSSIVDQIKVKTVFVSPIQRALQTTIHLFKNHPNKAKIEFIVLPIIREILNSSNDVGMDVYDLMTKYAHGNEICHGISFNFNMILSLPQPQLWQMYTMARISKQKMILDELNKMNIKLDDVVLDRNCNMAV